MADDMTTIQDEPVVVYDLTQALTEVMRAGLARAGYELTDEQATLPVMMNLAVDLDEDDRMELMADIITLVVTGEGEPSLEVEEDAGDPDEGAEDGEGASDDDTFGQLLAEDMAIIDMAETVAQGYFDQPDLTPDGDTERLLARQKEMMDTVFGGIGEETKPSKRLGLSRQQIQLEQHQALRLALGFVELTDVLAHLQRCLDDPAFGYGERGDNGRVIAQALDATRQEGQTFAERVADWWEETEPFRVGVYLGTPFSLRALFDSTTIDTFLPVLRRSGEKEWLLGSRKNGKRRTFEGDLFDVWHAVGDTVVEWTEKENNEWVEKIKAQAAQLPFNIQYPAIADRLDKEIWTVAKDALGPANELGVRVSRPPQDDAWPRFLAIGDRVGITRLNGHGFHEISWDGGESSRRFELSSTSKNRLPVEHTELALAMALVLAGPDYRPEPAGPAEIEAAFIRRMKASKIVLGPPPAEGSALLQNDNSTPAASFSVLDARGKEIAKAVFMSGGETIVLAVKNDQPVLALQIDGQHQVIAARPVVKNRVRPTSNIQTTPLNEVAWDPQWIRALSAWLAWLAWVL